MDFAKKQLEKYGWKDGEGLGKNKTGISKPIKPKLKFDTGGLGKNLYDDIDNTWWQRLYDSAANNIVTKNLKESVFIETIDDDSVEITTKKSKRKKRKLEEIMYKGFIKTSQLSDNKETHISIDKEEIDLDEEYKKKPSGGICELSDEELFKICGGRTVHKGARHGLKMNAKLARLEEQEMDLLKNMNKPINELKETSKYKSSKKKKKNI